MFIRIAQKREEAVAREVMKKIADDKKMNKKEKDERYHIYLVIRRGNFSCKRTPNMNLGLLILL